MNRVRIHKRSRRKIRPGIILVWCAFLLVVLLGMVGMVIDGGLLLASHRHAHNAADAAAMMAAMSLLNGQSVGTAQTNGTTAVIDPLHNNLPDATVTVNIPPQSGPYAGNASYAEAIVNDPIPTFFIHVLPGMVPGSTVNARAVAGYEIVNAGKGVMTLNPDAEPGLKISGGASLCVEGDVYVNSEGGGVDENGDPVVLDDPGQTATTVNNNGTLCAENVNVVGGVNPQGLDNITYPPENESEGSPLHANSLPEPDPLAYMATPTVSNGVVDIYHGAVQISAGGIDLDEANRDAGSQNAIVDEGLPSEKVVLYPGIYTSIRITGRVVDLMPGIYVLRPNTNTSDTLVITGDPVVNALGVMFYNTGHNYDQYTGLPDANDYQIDGPPPPPDGAHFGGVTINTNATLKGIDTAVYDYTGMNGIEDFNHMLFYQRRMNDERIQVEGNSSGNQFCGTVYAKWAELMIDGTASFQSSFIVGELKIEGQGTIEIEPNDDAGPQALALFLVE